MDLKKVADRLIGLYGNHTYDNPFAVYTKLTALSKNYITFFSNFTPEEILKLTFLIYSKLQTDGYQLGEKMINDLLFVTFIVKTSDLTEFECDTCGGSGTYSCDVCGGEGYYNCSECDGDGKLECSECDGVGLIDGEECEECDGTGKVDCDECQGEGSVNCSNCNGGDME